MSRNTNPSNSIESEYYEKNRKSICNKYGGKWIAILGKKIIASDKGITQLYEKVTSLNHKTPLIMFIPETEVQLL